MNIPRNAKRPEKANTQYPITSLFQVVPDHDGDPEIKFDYFTSGDLISFVGKTHIEIEHLEEGLSKAGKKLPDFLLKCDGVSIGAGFKSMNENAKYAYKCRLNVSDSKELARLPSGIRKMVDYQKAGKTPTGQALRKGLSLFFYPHVKVDGGWHIKILTEDYKALMYPILTENERTLEEVRRDKDGFPDMGVVGPSVHREQRDREFKEANAKYQNPPTETGFRDEVPF